MKFPSGTTDDLLRLIAEYPLAWLVSCTQGRFEATPLPLVSETDAAGELVALIGHCSRSNKQVADLQGDPHAIILFTGAQGYISPSLVTKKQWVPTWNFAVAAIHVEVEFQSEATVAAVDALVTHMETDHSPSWTLGDAGDRLDPLMSYIIGFRAKVRAIDARFKLGQDEGAQTISEIIGGIANPSLKSWMEHFNAERMG